MTVCWRWGAAAAGRDERQTLARAFVSLTAVTIASFVIAVLALIVAGAAAWYARRSALAAERQAKAAEDAVPLPPPPVSWQLERRTGDLSLLRNTGTSTAAGLTVVLPPEYFDRRLTVDLGDGVVAPGASVKVWDRQCFGEPDLDELPVIWDGQPTAVYVPFPLRVAKLPRHTTGRGDT